MLTYCFRTMESMIAYLKTESKHSIGDSNPENYIYSYDRILFEDCPEFLKTWFFAIGIDLPDYDPDTYTVSNWETISEYMREKFPDDTDLIWHRGGMRLLIKVLDSEGNPTEAALELFDVYHRLDQYPVFNDDHHSDLEYRLDCEGNEESIKSEYYEIENPDVPNNYVESTLRWLYKHNERAIEVASSGYSGRGGWIESDAILSAFEALGYMDENSPIFYPEYDLWV